MTNDQASCHKHIGHLYFSFGEISKAPFLIFVLKTIEEEWRETERGSGQARLGDLLDRGQMLTFSAWVSGQIMGYQIE